MTRSLVRFSSLLVAVATALVMPSCAYGVDRTQDPTATYMGQGIDPREASHHFCHTRDYPIVRCFDSQAEVDADLGWVEPQAPGQNGRPTADAAASSSPPAFTGPYTIAYWDINYGGSALTLYYAVGNLDALGWNDAISSIKSINCGVPRYWTDANYSGVYWQNGCNVWSPNLYSQNDMFSSVQNLAP
jgi:hypothetical protein